MEIRTSESVAINAATAARTVREREVDPSGTAPLSRRAVAATRRVIARPVVLTREQEYRFIRTDLRRLVLTSGVLFVFMIILLFIVE